MIRSVAHLKYRASIGVAQVLSLRVQKITVNDNSVIHGRMRPLSLKSQGWWPIIEMFYHLLELTMPIALPSATAPAPLETPVAAPAVDQQAAAPHASKSASFRRLGMSEPVARTPPTFVTSQVAMSFAFDASSKSLNVVMTDTVSGQLIRKFSYTSLPLELHRSDKLTGYLIDHNV